VKLITITLTTCVPLRHKSYIAVCSSATFAV